MRVVKTSNFSVNGCVLYKSDYSDLIFLPRFFLFDMIRILFPPLYGTVK